MPGQVSNIENDTIKRISLWISGSSDTSSPWPRSAASPSRRGGWNLSQPPLSQQIQALEAALGTQLLYRTSRRVELTQAGEALLARARAIQQQIKLAEDEVRAIGAGLVGSLDIGATGSILRGRLADLLAAYRKVAPAVKMTVHEQAPALQIAALLNRTTNISLNRSIPTEDALSSELAWAEEVVVAMPKPIRSPGASASPWPTLRRRTTSSCSRRAPNLRTTYKNAASTPASCRGSPAGRRCAVGAQPDRSGFRRCPGSAINRPLHHRRDRVQTHQALATVRRRVSRLQKRRDVDGGASFIKLARRFLKAETEFGSPRRRQMIWRTANAAAHAITLPPTRHVELHATSSKLS